MMWYESGGEGSRTALLLHGLGATAAVWKPVERALQERGSVRWLAADLGGHGGSDWQSAYSVGQLAAQLVELLQQQMIGEFFVVGHSLGAYVGLALASAWFGIQVRGVLGIGPKVSWPAADLQAARELATRPVRWYPTGEEALTRYRRVSGLGMDIAPGEERSEEHTSELQSLTNLVCRLLLEKKKKKNKTIHHERIPMIMINEQ